MNCDADATYTDYRSRFAAAKKAERMRDAVDHACTDFYDTTSTTATYDCSNGILSNSSGSFAKYTWSDAPTLPYHYMDSLSRPTEITTGSNDPIWVYREVLNVDALPGTYEGI